MRCCHDTPTMLATRSVRPVMTVEPILRITGEACHDQRGCWRIASELRASATLPAQVMACHDTSHHPDSLTPQEVRLVMMGMLHASSLAPAYYDRHYSSLHQLR